MTIISLFVGAALVAAIVFITIDVCYLIRAKTDLLSAQAAYHELQNQKYRREENL